jgi:hypothetical protein
VISVKLLIVFLALAFLTFVGFFFMAVMIPNAIAVPLGAGWNFDQLGPKAEVSAVISAFVSIAGAVSVLEKRLERRLQQPVHASRYRTRRF